MTADLAIEAALERGHVLDVIDVAMREQKKFEINTLRSDPVAGPLGRIEKDRAFWRVNQVAVGFENSAAERLVSHWWIAM